MGSRNFHFWALLATKIKLNLRSEVGKNQLSYAWWILEPTLEAAVLYLVLCVFLGQGTDSFVSFLLVGLIPWTWFSRSVGNAMMSLSGAGWLLHSFRIHPAFFPLVVVGQDAIKQAVTFSFLLLALWIFEVPVTEQWLLLPIAWALQFGLVTSASCLVASLIPLLQDLKFLVNTGLLAVMFASGIFYDAQNLVSRQWLDIFYLNPMASLIQLYRDILLGSGLLNLFHILVVVIWIMVLGFLAWLALRHYKDSYARLIEE
jgi:lipopolysaccharide transport system permease protein